MLKKKKNPFSTIHTFLKLILLLAHGQQTGENRAPSHLDPESPRLRSAAAAKSNLPASTPSRLLPEQISPGANLVNAEEGGKTVQSALERDTVEGKPLH